MKVNYTKKPTYESVEIIGKTTSGSIFGTIDRKSVNRVLITTEAGFTGDHEIVNSDGVGIRTVKQIGDEGITLFVELVGGIKSLSSYTFRTVYTSPNVENVGCTDIFVKMGTDCDKIGALLRTAERMSDAHPECDNQWKLVDSTGERVFIRIYGTIDERGKIVSE